MQHLANAAAKASTQSKSILCHSKRPHCTKTVSFCRDEEYRVYRADDYDRTPVQPSRDLSTRDYQELEEVLMSPSEHRQRIVGGSVHMGVVPLLQNDVPRSPPPPSQAQQTRFPSSPSHFTSFNFLPLCPEGTAQQRPASPPPPPHRTAPARSFPGFSFVSVVPVTDPPPPPPPVPQSRPTNFLPLTPVTAPGTSSTPGAMSTAPLTVSFKREPVTRPRSATPSQTTPISIPTPQPTHPSANSYRPRNSPPNASPPGRRDYRPTSSPTFCAPIAPAGPQSPRSSLLRSLAS